MWEGGHNGTAPCGNRGATLCQRWLVFWSLARFFALAVSSGVWDVLYSRLGAAGVLCVCLASGQDIGGREWQGMGWDGMVCDYD